VCAVVDAVGLQHSSQHAGNTEVWGLQNPPLHCIIHEAASCNGKMRGKKKEKTNNKKRGIASKILQKKLIRNELCLENGNMLDRSFRLGVGVVLKGNILSDASLAREVRLRSVYE